MVVALVALFVAMGGTGYAVSRLPSNSVGASQIRPNAVGASEIRRNAVGLSEITGAAENALEGQQGPPGIQGIQGIQGAQGERGLPGPPGFSELVYTSDVVVSPGGTQTLAAAFCPDGTRPVGGGGGGESELAGQQAVNFSGPGEDVGDPDELADAWIAFVDNNTASELEAYAFAVCAPAASVRNGLRPIAKVTRPRR